MTRTIALIALTLPALAGCTIAGDVLTPHTELKASCKRSDATPIAQTGLRQPGITTDPLTTGKGKPAT